MAIAIIIRILGCNTLKNNKNIYFQKNEQCIAKMYINTVVFFLEKKIKLVTFTWI